MTYHFRDGKKIEDIPAPRASKDAYQVLDDWLSRLREKPFPLKELLEIPRDNMGIKIRHEGKEGLVEMTIGFTVTRRVKI